MDIEKLKALALAASKGPWCFGEDYADNGALAGYNLHGDDGKKLIGEDVLPDEPDIAFMAAANPAAVLALIAEVERLRADAGRLDFVDRSGCAIRDFHDQRKNVIEWIAPGDLRGAIDAAIEKEKA